MTQRPRHGDAADAGPDPARRPGPRLVLIGLRGSGKSTAGRALAASIAAPFVDLDDRVAAALGAVAAGDALRAHGEPAFRRAERDELERALAEPGSVLALGGGTPTAPGAADLLRRAAPAVVYLRATPAELRRRLETAGTADRPSLSGAGTLDEIGALFAARDPLYRDLAAELGAVIETGGVTLDQGVTALRALLANP